MVVAIIDACIKHFKRAQNHVTRLYLKSDNAANLKNEILIRYLKDLNYTYDSQVEPVKAIGYVLSVPMDGKDLADLRAAVCNSKINREVNTGFSIDTPRNQAEAICLDGGLANCIVLFGKIIGGKQPPLKNKQIPTISKMHEFHFLPDGAVNIRRVASIGPGKVINLNEPFDLVPQYKYEIINKNELSKDGVPFKVTRNPLDKNKTKKIVTNQPSGDTANKKLNVMEHIRHGHIQQYGMEEIQEFQPEEDIGATSLLQKLDIPDFSENLLQLQTGTKWTPEHWTLKNLEVGHALPVWGSGTNKASEKVKDYLRKIFMEGEAGEGKVQATEAYQRMQEELDPATGAPLFNADEFQTIDQIKGFNSSTKRTRKISVPSSAKRQAASASTAPEGIAGLDFVDSSNGDEQQALEQEMRDMSATEGAVAMSQEALQIQAVFDDSDDDASDPIMVGEVNLCAIAELINVCIGKPLQKLSQDEKQAIAQKVEPDEARHSMIAKNTRLLTKAIMVFVRRECPYQNCGHMHR